MLIHPDLRALRGDDSPQRAAQAVLAHGLDTWRTAAQVAAVLQDFALFAKHEPLSECDALSALFQAGNPAAACFVAGFVQAAAAMLTSAPLGHLPMRHFDDGVLTTLVLAREGNATLSLVAIAGAALRSRPAAKAARFAPVETWENVLSGTAKVQQVSRRTGGGPATALAVQDRQLSPGSVTHRDEQCEARIVAEVQGMLVTLRLQRRYLSDDPVCEIDLATGRLIHQAANRSQDSRHELMLALLGRMGRSDAAPIMAAMARQEGAVALRWQSLRECLALDTSAGFAALCDVAASPGDPLAVPAGALRAQLLEAHPLLGALDPCPA